MCFWLGHPAGSFLAQTLPTRLSRKGGGGVPRREEAPDSVKEWPVHKIHSNTGKEAVPEGCVTDSVRASRPRGLQAKEPARAPGRPPLRNPCMSRNWHQRQRAAPRSERPSNSSAHGCCSQHRHPPARTMPRRASAKHVREVPRGNLDGSSNRKRTLMKKLVKPE